VDILGGLDDGMLLATEVPSLALALLSEVKLLSHFLVHLGLDGLNFLLELRVGLLAALLPAIDLCDQLGAPGVNVALHLSDLVKSLLLHVGELVILRLDLRLERAACVTLFFFDHLQALGKLADLVQVVLLRLLGLVLADRHSVQV
jgi:hypothetical protein